MSSRTNIVEESRERVQNAYQTVESEIQKIQKQVVEQRADFTKRTEKQLKRIRKELRSNKNIKPVIKRVESLRDDVSKELESRGKAIEKRWESGVETLLGNLNLASRSEVEKLENKLKRMTRKLNALDKTISQAPMASKTAVAE